MRRGVGPFVLAMLAAIVVVALTAGAAAAAGRDTVVVTKSSDSGPGSFRAAIAEATADPSIERIVFRDGLAPIKLLSAVTFGGGQSLTLLGDGAILDGTRLAASTAEAFLVNGGGHLSVIRLTVRNAPQQGMAYQVPADAIGVKEVSLLGVTVRGNGGHGVLVNDQENPENVGDADGSAASVHIRVVASRFFDNGFGALDRDGLRVNEGGLGELDAEIGLTKVEANGGDGVELDERADGDARFNVSATHIARNGNFDLVTDPDDGLDVDESGAGAVIGDVLASSASDNYEEGWDLNENDAGDFRVDMTFVEASRNAEEGIDFEEDDDFAGGGELVTTLVGIRANANGAGGDAGLKIREKGIGNLVASVSGVQANDNSSGGISVREDSVGNVSASIDRSTTNRNAGHGVDFDENRADSTDAGDLTATLSRATSIGNGGAGVRADQQTPGVGTLTLVDATLLPNGGGDIIAGNVTVTQTP